MQKMIYLSIYFYKKYIDKYIFIKNIDKSLQNDIISNIKDFDKEEIKMNSPIERLTKKEERSGFLMATLDEDELYAVQNFIAGMKATKEYVKMQEKEKEKAENPE